MMQCYMNIDSKMVSEARPGEEMPEELEAELFGPRPDRPQQVQQASTRQWQLLSSVVIENREDSQQQRGPGSGIGLVGTSFSGQTQVLYALGVFAVIFGFGSVTAVYLIRSEKSGR